MTVAPLSYSNDYTATQREHAELLEDGQIRRKRVLIVIKGSLTPWAGSVTKE